MDLRSRKCIVPKCLSEIGVSDVPFYYLPTEIKRKIKWLEIIERKDIIEQALHYERFRICSKHFSDKMKSSSTKLKIDAIPDLLLIEEKNGIKLNLEEVEDIPCHVLYKAPEGIPSTTNKMVDAGFRLRFDTDVPEEERKYYLKMYPNIELICQKKIHCTVCNRHLGTAPIQDSNIFMHPILKVTHCRKCNDFYNSGEFSKGDDGSELYCRWCGQGGQVYCCSKCPYVFCKSCIISNLSKGCINDIEQNENWNCFACAPKITWHLRAQHWALTNFIEKQRRMIYCGKYTEEEIRDLVLKDSSLCCPSSDSNLKMCINVTSDSSCDGIEQESSRKRKVQRKIANNSASKESGNQTRSVQQILAKKTKLSNNNEVVCTPDVLSILEPGGATDQVQKLVNNRPVTAILQPKTLKSQNQEQVQDQPINRPTTECFQKQQSPTFFTLSPPHTSTVQAGIVQPGIVQPGIKQPGIMQPGIVQPIIEFQTQQQIQPPPPLIIRNIQSQCRTATPNIQVRKTVVNARAPSHCQPVYHTINGYKIDLNSAAQQEVIRLPDGKFIQVKKQSSVAISPINPPNSAGSTTITPTVTVTPTATATIAPTIATPIAPAITSHFRHSTPNTVTPGVPFIVNNQIVRPQVQSQIATIAYTPAGSGINTSTATITFTQNRQDISGSVPFNNEFTIQSDPNRGIPVVNPPVMTQVQQLPAPPTAKLPVLLKQTFDNSPLGTSQTQLQNKVFSGMEICQHLTAKIFTLTNSNAYKSVRNISDVKELYIHLSYLFTYAIGRFKSLQEKCLEDMKKLGFSGDADSLEKGKLEKHASDGDEDEVEIVEPNTTCIDLDSDNEDFPIPTICTPDSRKETSVREGLVRPVNELETVNSMLTDTLSKEEPLITPDEFMNGLDVTANLLADILDVSLDECTDNTLEDSLKKPKKKIISKPKSKQEENLQNENVEGIARKDHKKLSHQEILKQIIRLDPKLKYPCSVVLTKLEDSFKKTTCGPKLSTKCVNETTNKLKESETFRTDKRCNQAVDENNSYEIPQKKKKFENPSETLSENRDDINKAKDTAGKIIDLDIINITEALTNKSSEKYLNHSNSNIINTDIQHDEVLEKSENSNDNSNTFEIHTASESSSTHQPKITICTLNENSQNKMDVVNNEELINVAIAEIDGKIEEMISNNQTLDKPVEIRKEAESSNLAFNFKKAEIKNSDTSQKIIKFNENESNILADTAIEGADEEDDKIYEIEIIPTDKLLDDQKDHLAVKEIIEENENFELNQNCDKASEGVYHSEENIQFTSNNKNVSENNEIMGKENSVDVQNTDNSCLDIHNDVEEILKDISAKSTTEEDDLDNNSEYEILKVVSSDKSDIEDEKLEEIKKDLEETEKKKKDDEDLMLLDGEKMREVLREFERSGGGFDDLDFMGIDEEGLF